MSNFSFAIYTIAAGAACRNDGRGASLFSAKDWDARMHVNTVESNRSA